MNLKAASEFQDWIFGIDLVEVQRTDSKYTWTNFQERDRRIFRKLDWCFGNHLWYNKIGEAACSVFNWSLSNHCSLLADMKRNSSNVKAPFRFFNMWCDHTEFLRIVEKIWCTPIKGSNMFKVYQKLRMLRVELRMLNRKVFAMIPRKITQICRGLEEIQRDLQSNPFNAELQRTEKALMIQLQKLLLWKEGLLKQKSRCQWDKLVDQNSRFLFKIL